jgi:hypothetical protein
MIPYFYQRTTSVDLSIGQTKERVGREGTTMSVYGVWKLESATAIPPNCITLHKKEKKKTKNE